MGEEGRWQARSITASVPVQDPLTCADVRNQAEHGLACLADKEEVRGSSPRRPTTRSSHLTALGVHIWAPDSTAAQHAGTARPLDISPGNTVVARRLTRG